MANTKKNKDLTVDEIRVAFTNLPLDKKVEAFKAMKEDLDAEEKAAKNALNLLSEVNGKEK